LRKSERIEDQIIAAAGLFHTGGGARPRLPTITVGTGITFAPSWTALASFTAQTGERRTVYGGLIGVNYAFGRTP